MSDASAPTEPTGEKTLREKTIFLVACGGLLLLLGLILGAVTSRRTQKRDAELQQGDEQGQEHALVVEGVAPRRMGAATEFVARAMVTNVGDEAIHDITLTLGAESHIHPVPDDATPTLQIEVLPPGGSKELIAEFRARDVGTTSLAAHAIGAGGRVAAGRYWDVEVVADRPEKPDYLPGGGLALRLSTFGPSVVEVGRPFELLTIIENSGQVVLEDLRLSIRAADNVRALHKASLDYEIERLLPARARAVRAKFRVDQPVARAQVHVYARDEKGWVAGIGVHTVTTE